MYASQHVETQFLVVGSLDQIPNASNRTMGDDVRYRVSVVDTLTQDYVEKQCLRLLQLKFVTGPARMPAV